MKTILLSLSVTQILKMLMKEMRLVGVTKAKEDGEDEFEVDGKTYKVKEDICPSCGEQPCVDEASCSEEDEEVEEGNALVRP